MVAACNFGASSMASPTNQQTTVRWHPPQLNEVKLNFDGSYDPESGYGAAAFVIRNTEGVVVQARAIPVDVNSAFEAETFAVWYGVRELVTSYSEMQVWIEGDNAAVLALISKGIMSVMSPLLRDCVVTLEGLFQWRASHIYREGNQAANWLANECRKQGTNLLFVGRLPSDLELLIKADAEGYVYERR